MVAMGSSVAFAGCDAECVTSGVTAVVAKGVHGERHSGCDGECIVIDAAAMECVASVAMAADAMQSVSQAVGYDRGATMCDGLQHSLKEGLRYAID